jgi:hypothetical protein
MHLHQYKKKILPTINLPPMPFAIPAALLATLLLPAAAWRFVWEFVRNGLPGGSPGDLYGCGPASIHGSMSPPMPFAIPAALLATLLLPAAA